MVHGIALRLFGRLPRRVRHRLVRILSPTFTGGAVAAVTDPTGRILLVQHSYNTGWALPGGLLDRGEDPRTTATREISEEVGLDLTLSPYPAAVLTPGRAHVNFVFTATADADQALAAASRTAEIVAVGWHDLTDLPELMEYTDLLLDSVGLYPTADAALGPLA
jgi:8-oxo-dGTP diphosphatase